MRKIPKVPADENKNNQQIDIHMYMYTVQMCTHVCIHVHVYHFDQQIFRI